jgi:hypothetical protein
MVNNAPSRDGEQRSRTVDTMTHCITSLHCFFLAFESNLNTIVVYSHLFVWALGNGNDWSAWA